MMPSTKRGADPSQVRLPLWNEARSTLSGHQNQRQLMLGILVVLRSRAWRQSMKM